MIATPFPERTEAADSYFTYIDQVRPGNICNTLEAQLDEAMDLFRPISEEKSLHRYAPDKWSIRQVVSHITDTERVFAFRALWFARGFDSPLPGFDQNIAIAGADADARPWSSHVDEFRIVRSASVALFRSLSSDAWTRRGIASENLFTVRAVAFITAGHVAHHLKILRERYL